MPLLSVYNNLIHGYLMTRQTRFDSHNSNELRAIHSRIRAMSMEQPLYKIDFDDDAQEYTLSVKEQAMDLAASLKELKESDESSVFLKKTVISDKPDILKVELPYGRNPATLNDTRIKIMSLASTQLNEGRYVVSKMIGLTGGQYSFTVEIEDAMYSFQFNVTENSTYRELQTKLSDFINKAKVGLRSRVVTEGNKTRLETESIREGSAFAFKDTKLPQGADVGIVELFGLDTVTREAALTKAVIGGKEIESRNNEYITSDGVKYTFLNVTEEDSPAFVKSVTDDSVVIDKIEGFIDKYNSLSSYVRVGGETRRASKKLYYEMNRFLSEHIKSFAEKGLIVDSDGIMSIDYEKIVNAIRNGSLEKMFNENSDITSELLKKLCDISINPINYIDKTIVVYNNFNAKGQYNPYVSSVYSGIIYNNYC